MAKSGFSQCRTSRCSWNYCSACKRRRTRYPNSTQCKVCYDSRRGGWKAEGTKSATREREHIASFLVELGQPDLAELVRSRAYL
jgi:hypothetical protein